jgi:hypothetical protein
VTFPSKITTKFDMRKKKKKKERKKEEEEKEDIVITFLVIYNEYSFSTSSFCKICLGCEFAEASIHHYNISSELTESISKYHTHIGINKYIFLMGMIIYKCLLYEKKERKKNLILWCTTTIARV